MQKLLAHSFICTLFFGTALIAHATVSYQNPITYGGITTIPEFLLAVVDLVFLIGIPIIVLCIIYSGFLFVSAGDNEAGIRKAKMVFMWTIVGALVLLGAKAIAMAIQGTVLSLGST